MIKNSDGVAPIRHHRVVSDRLTSESLSVTFGHASTMAVIDFVSLAGASAMVASVLWLHFYGFHWFLLLVWFVVPVPVMTAWSFRREYDKAVSLSTIDDHEETWEWQEQVKRVETVTEEKHTLTVRIEDGSRCEYAHFPYDVELFERVSFALMSQGVPFSRPKLCKSVDGLSEAKFSRVQSWALQNNLIAWSNPDNHRHGVRLTPLGQQIFHQALQSDGIKKLELKQ